VTGIPTSPGSIITKDATARDNTANPRQTNPIFLRLMGYETFRDLKVTRTIPKAANTTIKNEAAMTLSFVFILISHL
jgi:hypothetical protein